MFTPVEHAWGAPCPDFRYHWTAIDGARTYRIWGQRGNTLWLNIQAQRGWYGDDNINIGSWDVDDFTLGADGSYEIIASPTPQRGNWIKLDPTAPYTCLLVRDIWDDWDDPRGATIHIECLAARREDSLFHNEAEYCERLTKIARQTQVSVDFFLGTLDAVFDEVGFIAPDGRKLADMDPQSFDRIVAINLSGVFNGISSFAADMRTRRKGHIVNTSSMAGLAAIMFPRIGGYAAAKYAVVALSEVLRIEMAPHDVGVSVLCPGMVPTNLWQTTIKLGSRFPIPEDSERSGAGVSQTRSLVSAADVGEIVARGIAENLAYIITHPDDWPGVERRMRALEAAFLPR
jgi:NAD(P)-dependent dehydrogenase (short-subunit alcohol dehydrogenase family)